jgi:hypothetical protein
MEGCDPLPPLFVTSIPYLLCPRVTPKQTPSLPTLRLKIYVKPPSCGPDLPHSNHRPKYLQDFYVKHLMWPPLLKKTPLALNLMPLVRPPNPRPRLKIGLFEGILL